MVERTRASYEANSTFQVNLHLSNAVHHDALGYTAREGLDFLQKAADLKILTQPGFRKDDFYQLVK